MVAGLLIDFHRDFMPREYVYSRAPEVLRIATMQRFILIGLIPLAVPSSSCSATTRGGTDSGSATGASG